MSWPTDDISTRGLDSATTYNSAIRSLLWTIVKHVKVMIGARGAPDGVAALGSSGKVPDEQIGRAVADGVASLNANGKVPDEQTGRAAANGVCDLDGDGMVPGARIGKGQADGVASLDAFGQVPDGQLGRGEANGVCELDSDGNVPIGRIYRGTPDTVAQLNSAGKVPTSQLPGKIARAAAWYHTVDNRTLHSFGVSSVQELSGGRVRFNLSPSLSDYYPLPLTEHSSLVIPIITNVSASYVEVTYYAIGHDGANNFATPGRAGIVCF